MKKVMIVAGGTGGHIYPALALAKVLQETHPNIEIIFLGSKKRMEADLIPEKGYRFIGLDIISMNGAVWKKAKSILHFAKAITQCNKILKKEQPDICVGFGNYISIPLILSAYRMKIPTMIHEQNSFSGKANVFLSKFVTAIVVSYQTSLSQFPIYKTKLLGNPQETIAVRNNDDKRFFSQYGFSPKQPIVSFMMGSLGSSSVSKIIDQCLNLIQSNAQILVASGKANSYVYKTLSNDRIKIVSYVDGIDVLKNSSISILRAGATTICEVSAIGVCSILVPSPYVPNDHQTQNAMVLVQNDATILMKESQLNAEDLAKQINELICDRKRCTIIAENAKKLAHPSSAYKIVEWMEELTINGSIRK